MLVATLSLVVIVGCGGYSQRTEAEITDFEIPSGTIQPGSPAIASMRVENTGDSALTLWLGYSVQDPAGEWYDAPMSPVELDAGEESETQELSTGPLETPGYYKTVISVWSGKPGNDAQRLANAEEIAAFRVSSMRDDFDSSTLDPDRWETTTRELGRGKLEPENVGVEDGQLRVTLPAETLDGGQIESKGLYGPGFYAARIKVPDVPSSITGFFLYETPDLASEIDIEIYNDSSRRVLFTTYTKNEDGSSNLIPTHTTNGEPGNEPPMTLPFDPTAGMHSYRFDFYPGSVSFYVDDALMIEWTNGLPSDKMQLFLNAWYPRWMSQTPPPTDRYLKVEWIRH